jgi:hypothetical protein
MKKENNEYVPVTVVHGFSGGDWSKVIGKVLTLIDTLGLKEEQGKAVKDLMMQQLWDSWYFAIEQSRIPSKVYRGVSDHE